MDWEFGVSRCELLHLEWISNDDLLCIREKYSQSLFFLFFFWSFFVFFRATPTAYGGAQARGPVRAVAASLCQSHSNAGSEPRLQPTPQLTAMPDPQPTEQGQGWNPYPHGC